jgi:N-acetyl-gamma-glutamyl-phosphate reductase
MTSIAVCGASGYSGIELVRLLARRDDVTLTHAFAASSAGKRLSEIAPDLSGYGDTVCEPYDPSAAAGADIVFIALPSGEAMNIVPSLLGRVGKIIDLGGDFRLASAEAYREFYGREHAAPEFLGRVVYGLPEVNADAIAVSNLVANPGCYPTAAILALAPVLKHGLVRSDGIGITAMSGTTGAGRTSSSDYSFSELNENIRAYKIGTHQHGPEIRGVLSRITGMEVTCSFVPHLVPLSRGIYSTVHAVLAGPVSEETVAAAYRGFYAGAPFVRIRKEIPRLKDVVRTNFCDISFRIDRPAGQLVIVSVIDNLVKGAAGQAVQNMNVLLGCSQDKGLRY